MNFSTFQSINLLIFVVIFIAPVIFSVHDLECVKLECFTSAKNSGTVHKCDCHENFIDIDLFMYRKSYTMKV